MKVFIAKKNKMKMSARDEIQSENGKIEICGWKFMLLKVAGGKKNNPNNVVRKLLSMYIQVIIRVMVRVSFGPA